MTGVPLEQDELEADMPPLPETELNFSAFEQRLDDMLANEDASWLGRWRALPVKKRLIAWTGAALLAIAFAVFVSRRGDWQMYPKDRMVVVVAVLAALWAAGALWLHKPLDRPAEGRIAGAGWILLGLSVPLGFALLPMAHEHHELSRAGVGHDLVPRALGCVLWGTFTALPATAILLITDRQPSRRRRLFAGAVGGLLANLTLQLHCPLTSRLHLVLGHFTVGLVLVVIAALFARRFGPTS